MATVKASGMEALEKLKSTEPPVFLAPSSISDVARVASQYLFTKLKPYNDKSPFDELLVDGFDGEQIWQQIDMQSQPLLSSLKQEVKRFGNNPQEISKLGNLVLKEDDVDEMDMDGFDSDEDDDDDDDVDDNEELEANEEEEEEEENGEDKEGVEDKFFKIKELEQFLVDGEAEEYGEEDRNKKGVSKRNTNGFGDDEDEDEDEEDEEFGLFDGRDNEDSGFVKARYDDFFGGGKKKEIKPKFKDLSEGEDEEPSEEEEPNKEEEPKRGNQAIEKLSTHEKERLKLQSKIEQMEKARLDPKHWTMMGEVSAATRPKNSALEVDLDFEHNVRPPPVMSDEATASLEDLIRGRIIEGRFDDVQRAPALPTKTKRELKEVDDNKSKRGLAEVYEAEYVQKANPTFVPVTHSDELKKEASMLFKKLCLKLDALSHFHFTPKPVIEEMNIQTNVPAIAMEEVAPVAVSDAAMLAPEEIFVGKGNIKDESELTQEDRKRRRAKKKRKFKAESANQPVKKARDTTKDSKTEL